MTQFASTLYPQTNPSNQVLLTFRDDFASYSRSGNVSRYAREYLRYWGELAPKDATPSDVAHAKRVLTRLANLSG